MRAPPYRPSSNPVFVVPGFYDKVANPNPRHPENSGWGSVAAADGSTPHHPLMTEPDMEMDTHDTAINADDPSAKSGSQKERDAFPDHVGSPSTSSQTGDFSLKEPQATGTNPCSLGVSDCGKVMGIEPKEKVTTLDHLKSNDSFQDKLDEIDRDLRKFEEDTSENRPISAVGLGPPTLEKGSVVSSCSHKGPSDPNPGFAGPIKSPHPPSPPEALSPNDIDPRQYFSNGSGKELEVKPRKVKIKLRKDSETHIPTKTTLSPAPTRKRPLPETSDFPTPKRRGALFVSENYAPENTNSTVVAGPQPRQPS